MKSAAKASVLDEALRQFISHLQKSRFFGVVELHYQDGHLLRVKREEVVSTKDLLRLLPEIA